MTFAEIRTAVHDGWEFVWPPIAILAVEAGVCAFVAPTLWRRWAAATTTIPLAATAESLRAVAEPYGLTAIVPLVAIVAILLALYLVNRITSGVGNLIPPQVTYSLDIVLARVTTTTALARFWAATPYARDLQDIVEIIQARLSAATQPEIANAGKYWTETSGRAYQAMNVAKLVMMTALVVGGMELVTAETAGAVVRAFAVMLLAVVVGALALIVRLYALEQEWYARVSAFETLLNLEQSSLTKQTALPDELLHLYDTVRQKRGWWHLRVPTFPYVRWVRDRLFRNLI